MVLCHKLKFIHYFQDKEEGISSEMASKLPAPSRLALPSASKRRREGSLDLETGLDPKKSRGAPEPASNLVKSKSKSMMNIAGRPATVNPRFESFL